MWRILKVTLHVEKFLLNTDVVCNLRCFVANLFCCDLRFSVWKILLTNIIYVEKKWQISGMAVIVGLHCSPMVVFLVGGLKFGTVFKIKEGLLTAWKQSLEQFEGKKFGELPWCPRVTRDRVFLLGRDFESIVVSQSPSCSSQPDSPAILRSRRCSGKRQGKDNQRRGEAKVSDQPLNDDLVRSSHCVHSTLYSY